MLLAVNTCTFQLGLALLKEDGTVVAECLIFSGSKHFASLMPALRFLLDSSATHIKKIKAIVTALGPGSYTGLRVGLSASKGLCHSLNIPIIGIPSLEAMASQVSSTGLPIAPILDSRKGEIFTAQFLRGSDGNLLRTRDDTAIKFSDLPSLFKEQTMIIGNDFPRQAPQITEILGSVAVLAPPYLWNLKASALGFLGMRRFRARDFDDPAVLTPIYLRAPDIRPNPNPLSTQN